MSVTLHVVEPAAAVLNITLHFNINNVLSRRCLQLVYFQHPSYPVVVQHGPSQMFIQFQMRCISLSIPSIITNRTAFKSHDSLHENDSVPIYIRSIHIELRRDLSMEHFQFEISSQYTDHFKSLIYHRISITNTQIENQSKAKNLVLKMSVLPSSSGQYIQSYIEIFASNIRHPIRRLIFQYHFYRNMYHFKCGISSCIYQRSSKV